MDGLVDGFMKGYIDGWTCYAVLSKTHKSQQRVAANQLTFIFDEEVFGTTSSGLRGDDTHFQCMFSREMDLWLHAVTAPADCNASCRVSFFDDGVHVTVLTRWVLKAHDIIDRIQYVVWYGLTHWGRYKMTDILQKTFSNDFFKWKYINFD